MTDTSNNVLVEAAQAGDTEAFAALVEKHYSMVHGLAFSKVGDWTVAEDLTQDVFLVVWTNLNKLKHPEAFLVWLRRISRNAALNWIRRKQYRRELAQRNQKESGDMDCVAADPSGDAARRECLEHIGEALQSLSPKLRDAMVMFYLEGHTASMSADVLGISVDTMKKRLRLGRAKMARYYERYQAENLEQLLPHRPKKRIENIVAGLAVGPVLPHMGVSISMAGPAMWIEDILNGASPWVLKSSAKPVVMGFLGSFKAAAAGAALLLVSTGAVGVLALMPSKNDPAAANVLAQPEDSSLDYQYSTEIALETTPDERANSYILVDKFIPEADSVEDGLQKGDRIVEVNGLPLSDSILDDPRAVLFGQPGTRVRVTVMRPNKSGRGEQKLHLDILRPYQPNRFGLPESS